MGGGDKGVDTRKTCYDYQSTCGAKNLERLMETHWSLNQTSKCKYNANVANKLNSAIQLARFIILSLRSPMQKRSPSPRLNLIHSFQLLNVINLSHLIYGWQLCIQTLRIALLVGPWGLLDRLKIRISASVLSAPVEEQHRQSLEMH